MSRPLLANPKRQSEASSFHRAVFALYGGPLKICALCQKPGATDAAHVIGRAHLGPLRYADPGLARPAHRRCHDDVDQGRIDWPVDIRRAAVRCHNKLARVKLEIP